VLGWLCRAPDRGAGPRLRELPRRPLPRTPVNTSGGRRAFLRQRLDAVAGSDPTARKYVGSQPAPVYEAAQHPGLRQPFEVQTRLAPPLAEALDLPHPEAPSDEVIERDAPHDEVASRLDGRQLDAFGGQLLQRFGLHQGEVVAAPARVGEGAGPALVAVAPQAASLDRLRRGNLPHGAFCLGGQRDQFDRADALGPRTGLRPPSRVVLREHEGRVQRRVLLAVGLGHGIVHDARGHAEVR
jgi:hypothetical protein